MEDFLVFLVKNFILHPLCGVPESYQNLQAFCGLMTYVIETCFKNCDATIINDISSQFENNLHF